MPRCLNCRDKFTPKYFLAKFCGQSSCRIAENEYNDNLLKSKIVNKKPIKKISDKRLAMKNDYEIVKSQVLSEAKFRCFVDNCNNVANTIEHQRGHKGFYDDWARDNNISLHIDKRFLKACCWHHNQEFENNPELSKKYQLSKIHKGNKI